MASENEYTRLIAGLHVDRPRFTQWIYELTAPFQTARERLTELYRKFDVDRAAGDQLDAVGVRVGVNRSIPEKIEGVFFAFDDVDGYGFDYGVWLGRYESGEAVTSLDDETYRGVIKAKIAQNHWNGTNEARLAFVRSLSASFGVRPDAIYLQDLQDMSVRVWIVRDALPPLVQTLIERRIIDFIPAGVSGEIHLYSPAFALDANDIGMRGLDLGEWSND